MRRALAAALFVILSGLLVSRAEGQSNADPKAQSTPLFNVDTTLVLIPATVTDPSNRYLLGLQKQDFHLFEDGVEQTITHFSGEDAPLSVGLVFDLSASMGDKLRTSREAALQFLKPVHHDDDLCGALLRSGVLHHREALAIKGNVNLSRQSCGKRGIETGDFSRRISDRAR